MTRHQLRRNIWTSISVSFAILVAFIFGSDGTAIPTHVLGIASFTCGTFFVLRVLVPLAVTKLSIPGSPQPQENRLGKTLPEIFLIMDDSDGRVPDPNEALRPDNRASPVVTLAILFFVISPGYSYFLGEDGPWKITTGQTLWFYGFIGAWIAFVCVFRRKNSDKGPGP